MRESTFVVFYDDQQCEFFKGKISKNEIKLSDFKAASWMVVVYTLKDKQFHISRSVKPLKHFVLQYLFPFWMYSIIRFNLINSIPTSFLLSMPVAITVHTEQTFNFLTLIDNNYSLISFN